MILLMDPKVALVPTVVKLFRSMFDFCPKFLFVFITRDFILFHFFNFVEGSR